MADKGPWGKASWNTKRKVHSNHELNREGGMARGSSELHKGAGTPPSNPELSRPGTMPATMPELDRGGFRGQPFIDRTAQNEAMKESAYDEAFDLVPGHKQMAGMP